MGFSTILKTVAMVVVATTVLAFAGPVRAEWRRAETAHFIVYGDASEGDIRAFSERIERFDALLRAYYPIEVEYEIPKLEIYLAQGRRDMNQAYPGIGGSVAGFYDSNNGRIYAVVNTQIGTGDGVLFHEYAHHFMFQMRANAYPSWFVEGFAEYYGTAEIRQGAFQIGRHDPMRMHALTRSANSWAKMEDVLKWRYTPSGRYPAGAYYAQAWAMTHYFMSTPERTRMLGQYLARVVRGEDSVEAMQAATGRTATQLQEDVRSYMGGSIAVLTPQIELPRPEVTITTLTQAESAMAWLDIRLDNTEVIVTPPEEDGGTRKSEAQKAREAREEAEFRAELIRDSLAAAERFPGNRMGLLVKARAQRLQHDPAAALATLEPLIGPESTDGDALRVAAMALLDLAAKTEDDTEIAMRRRASGLLARSMNAEPLDFRTYLGLNEVRRGLVGYPTDNDITTLEAAVGLAPQSFEARLRLGSAYLARQMNEQAVTVLMPVSNSPHRSSYTRRAREMIGTARQAMGQTVQADETLPEEAVAAEPASAGAE